MDEEGEGTESKERKKLAVPFSSMVTLESDLRERRCKRKQARPFDSGSLD